MRLHELMDHVKSGGTISRHSWRDALRVQNVCGKTFPQQRWLVWYDPRKLLLVPKDMTISHGPIHQPDLYEVFVERGVASWLPYTISADAVIADDWGILIAEARQPEESR